MRLIDADALWKEIITAFDDGLDLADLREHMDAQPTIEAEPVKHGRWIYDDEAYPGGNPYGHYVCDQCGEYVPHKTNYCPNCGAKMDEVDDV